MDEEGENVEGDEDACEFEDGNVEDFAIGGGREDAQTEARYEEV